MQGTPLIESEDMAAMSSTAVAEPAQPTVAGQSPQTEAQPVAFSLGGPDGQPAVRVGSLSLGYQDVLLILVLLQAATAALTAFNLWGE